MTQRTLAAIDIGTNAMRIKVLRLTPDGHEELHYQRDANKPGEGVFETGAIADEAVARVGETLCVYEEIIASLGADVRAVATAAYRHARNRDEVIAALKAMSGIDVNVIAGVEEARLISLAALHDIPADHNTAIIDIGGGSTEVIIAQGREPVQSWSLGLGALRLHDHFVDALHPKGRLSAKSLHLMRQYVVRACETEFGALRPQNDAVHALGTSGSVRALVRFCNTMQGRPSKAAASHADIRSALAKLARMSLKERETHFPPARAKVIVGAAAILTGVMDALEIDTIERSGRSLRDGVLFDMMEDVEVQRPEMTLLEGARALGARFGFAAGHGDHAAYLAGLLFDETVALHKLDRRQRVLLQAAAVLHDVGYAVNRQKHHRHSEYIVENASLPRVSVREQRLIARLCRYHRRRLPTVGHEGLEGLEPVDVETLRRLVPLLRLADALDRGHHAHVTSLKARSDGAVLNVKVVAPSGAPLEVWDAERERAAFLELYGLDLALSVARTDAG